MDNSIEILRKCVVDKEQKVKEDRYAKSCFVARFQNHELAPFMRHVLQSLELINQKLKNIE
jgi:hypothetical protein